MEMCAQWTCYDSHDVSTLPAVIPWLTFHAPAYSTGLSQDLTSIIAVVVIATFSFHVIPDSRKAPNLLCQLTFVLYSRALLER
jgi:hypothetical protein